MKPLLLTTAILIIATLGCSANINVRVSDILAVSDDAAFRNARETMSDVSAAGPHMESLGGGIAMIYEKRSDSSGQSSEGRANDINVIQSQSGTNGQEYGAKIQNSPASSQAAGVSSGQNLQGNFIPSQGPSINTGAQEVVGHRLHSPAAPNAGFSIQSFTQHGPGPNPQQYQVAVNRPAQVVISHQRPGTIPLPSNIQIAQLYQALRNNLVPINRPAVNVQQHPGQQQQISSQVQQPQLQQQQLQPASIPQQISGKGPQTHFIPTNQAAVVNPAAGNIGPIHGQVIAGIPTNLHAIPIGGNSPGNFPQLQLAGQSLNGAQLLAGSLTGGHGLPLNFGPLSGSHGLVLGNNQQLSLGPAFGNNQQLSLGAAFGNNHGFPIGSGSLGGSLSGRHSLSSVDSLPLFTLNSGSLKSGNSNFFSSGSLGSDSGLSSLSSLSHSFGSGSGLKSFDQFSLNSNSLGESPKISLGTDFSSSGFASKN